MKEKIKKIYHFIFVEDSWISYVVFTILAYVILKFAIYPGILYATGLTDVSGIVTGSMVHSGDINYTYKNWLIFHGYNYSSNWPLKDGINIGDVVLIKKVNDSQIHVGDVIMYKIYGIDIVHRVINKSDGRFETKGDANPYQLPFEKNISYNMVVGKVVGKIPYLGWPKVLLTYLIMKVK